jgi:arylsulfatase A-like enzyme
MTDTQRTDMVGCYGNSEMHTPSIDGLAAQGVRFDRAYTCQPVCAPARAGMFTGVFPHSNGVWSNCLPLGDNVKTIGQRLSDNGVHTAYVGKWHLDGGDYFGLGRCPDGWDPEYWYDMRLYLEELTPEERLRSRQPQTSDDPALTEDFTYGHRCANRARDFLTRHHEDPFLLVVSFDEPHDPSLCPKSYVDRYRDYELPKSPNVWDRLENKPEHQRVWGGKAVDADRDALRLRAPYLFGCNTFVDYEIGRVLEAVEEYAPGALVIYTSDHGDALASHCLWAKGPAMYDEIARVPLIVRWPGVTPEGTASAQPMSHIDLCPTIMEALGMPVPRILEGHSAIPALADPQVQVNDAVFMEFGRYEVDHDGFGGFQPVRAVFDGRYKLVINLLTSDELYDLQDDPHEMTNLIEAGGTQPVRDRLHDRLLAWMNETRDPFRGYYWERRPWRSDAREATWDYTLCTRQRENEEYEPRQLDYGTGLEMEEAVRLKGQVKPQ